MNKQAAIFKPEDVKVTLNGKEYRLVYDLNAFCELEKIYDSIDDVLQMLLGGAAAPELDKVTYQGQPVDPSEILIDQMTLAELVAQHFSKGVKKATHRDTLNLLYAGLLHDHAIYDEFDEITGYSISKSKVGSFVTFRNIREINAQIALAIFRDLIPPANEEDEKAVKNEQAPEQESIKLVKAEE